MQYNILPFEIQNSIEIQVLEIANLVFGSAGSSNVEPFTQLILKPMECGSTLWNQTKLWQQIGSAMWNQTKI